MKYLIFEKLSDAIKASIYIYWNFKRKKQIPKKENINPVVLENGKYSLEKPADNFMFVDFYEILEIINKTN